MDPSSITIEHPLERFSGGGWLRGLARLGAGLAVLGVVLVWTGGEALEALWRIELLPWLLGGAALAGSQRALRVYKWAGLVESAPSLRSRPLGWLLRLQFVGLLANLLLPVSEALKIWAVSQDRRGVPRAVESLTVDTALLTAAAAAVGLPGAALVYGEGASGWPLVCALALLVASAALLAALRWRPWARADGERVRWGLAAVGWSLVEAGALCGVYVLAMGALGLELSWSQSLALLPLLYLGHLVMLTPSGLGVREALYAAVFGGLLETPGETAVAVGLLVSSMQLVVALVGGGVALAWPGGIRK